MKKYIILAIILSVSMICNAQNYIISSPDAAGGEWYIGALTNWSERELSFNLSFLSDGDYVAEIYQDGVNANRMAQDFKRVEVTVKKDAVLTATLARCGGWVARIHKK